MKKRKYHVITIRNYIGYRYHRSFIGSSEKSVMDALRKKLLKENVPEDLMNEELRDLGKYGENEAFGYDMYYSTAAVE